MLSNKDNFDDYIPLTGAPSMISYLAIVSFSLNVFGPKIQKKN